MKNAITFDFTANLQKDSSAINPAGMKEAISFDPPNMQENSSPESCIGKKDAIYFECNVKDEQGGECTIKVPQAFVGKVTPTFLTLQDAKEFGTPINQHLNASIIPSSCPDSAEELQKINEERKTPRSADSADNSNTPMNSSQKANVFETHSHKTSNNSFGKNVCSIEPAIPAYFPEISSEEKKSLSAPKNDFLPSSPLPEAHIYMPAPLNNSEFLNTETIEREEKNNQLPVRIYKNIKLIKKIRSYENNLYLFDSEKGVYKKMSPSDLHHLINRYYGEKIEKQGNTSCYYIVEDFMKKDCSIVINEAHLLPLEYWGFPKGFYNIYNGNLIPNDGTYFVRHVLQCDFIPNALCPNFDQYISSITADDGQLITLLWEVLGYLLSNDTNGKVFIAFIGKKDTGKSLLANIISKIVGEDGISHLSANDFSGRFDVCELNGKKLNICMDLPDRALSPDAVGKIKSITGNDIIRSDVKHKDSISFKPTARLLFGSNSLIRTELPDSAFYERLIVIPFFYPVPKEKQDHRLEEKLVAEASGICLKAMEYYKNLRKRGYIFTKVSLPDGLNASIDYDTVVKTFSQEYCEFTRNPEDKISSASLYMHFENFCRFKNLLPLSQAEFSKKFNKLFSETIEKKKLKLNGVALNGFSGIRFKGGVHNENN